MKEPPLGGVEVIEEADHLWPIEPVIAQPLADMGPVFPLDMGIVVLVIGFAPCELDRVVPVEEVSEGMVVEELASVLA